MKGIQILTEKKQKRSKRTRKLHFPRSGIPRGNTVL